MRILISGATGLLGSSLSKLALREDIEVKNLVRSSIDFSSIANIVSKLNLSQFDVLVHCAANTNVEYCESHPEESYNDNVLLTEVLANACAISNTKMVFVSSTGVYGENSKEPYTEFDAASPTTVHHLCKLEAENLVMLLAPRPLVIRTGWLFGGSVKNNKNFVANRIREAIKSNGIMHSDVSQIGNPTFVDDLARQLISLIMDQRMGLFNCVNLGRASRFEYVQAIIAAAKLNIKVEPVSSTSFERLAKVSSNESAVNRKLSLLGLNQMPDWQESLNNYVQQIGNNL